MITVRANIRCEYVGKDNKRCLRKATTVADSGNHLGVYCNKHVDEIPPKDAEYHVSCPNCGCHFGVN